MREGYCIKTIQTHCRSQKYTHSVWFKATDGPTSQTSNTVCVFEYSKPIKIMNVNFMVVFKSVTVRSVSGEL